MLRVVGLALLVGVVCAVPGTYQTFTTSFKNKFSSTMPPLSIDVEQSGTLQYDALTSRQRADVTSAKMTIKMDTSGGGLGGGDTGGGLDNGDGGLGGGDTSGGLGGGATSPPMGGGGLGGDLGGGLDGGLGRRLLQGGLGGGLGGDQTFEIEGTFVELLRYDIGKNFTWFTTPGAPTKCECSKLEGVLPPMYVTADAVQEGADETITVNSASVSTSKYINTIELGPSKAEFAFYVEGTEKLARVTSKSSMDTAGISMATTENWDFWGMKNTVAASVWKPHASCKCAEPPVVVVAPTYPAPTAVCTPDAGCKCWDDAAKVDIVFCKDLVSYPVKSAIFPKATDDFVKSAYELASFITSQKDSCKASYKEFLCHFYFQKCTKGGVPALPGAFASPECDAATVTSVGGTSAGETYVDAATFAAGGGVSGGSKVVPAISLVLLLVSLILA